MVKNHQKLTKLLFIFVLCFLFSCNQDIQISNSNMENDFVDGTIPLDNSPSHSITPSITITPTITYIDEAKLRIFCSEDLSSKRTLDNFNWLVAIQTREGVDGHLWDIKNNKKIQFSEENETSFYISVSPDGKMMAYNANLETKEGYIGRVVVMNSKGNRVYEIDWDKNEDYYPLNWLDERHLWIYNMDEDTEIYLLEPQTGEKTEYTIEFPDQYNPVLYPSFIHDFFKTLRSVYYSPTLDTLVYTDFSIQNYILWNIKKNEEYKRIPFLNAIYAPKWSPNGDSFIISAIQKELSGKQDNYQELYQIFANGEVDQLTFLSNYYRDGVFIDKYGWSPDGQLIAFWFKVLPDQIPSKYFGIYDVKSKQVSQYCIDEPLDTKNPIWSPDSKFLILNIYKDARHNKVYLFDVEKQSYYFLANNIDPAGIMDK